MINSGEPVEVRGFVDGSITAPAVHIFAQAMVIGDLVAAEAFVDGQVQGNIFSDNLILEANSQVAGEIYYANLDLRGGAYFEGKSRKHPRPRSLAPTLSLTDISIWR